MARQIIIIDDNVSDSNEMERLLSGFGADIFQSLRIGSAKDHLKKFKTGDIVICDFKVADGNAVELMEWLDNIQHLSQDMQSIMLHVIANYKQSPRIIATASPDITEMVVEGGFLSALFYKIKEFTITLPPLRECQDDITLLADFYLRHYNQEFHKQVKRFNAAAQREMQTQSWSGNIRELKHVVRVAVLKSRGEIITPKELDFDSPTTGAQVQFKLKTSNEKNKITAAIAHANGNFTQAANLLGISHKALWAKRKKYGLA